ncbi:UDP-galactopyranose mutase [Halioxenophilus sp. WMMB6]|uniref:UDP-galactopyranose mutase n=1 Tax=Halioxenophilus sp. WMMB6 TaxID=3073815 RepID=UPI00295E4770|nr:UDP-galactopyranose mutase [Halioxenophilus sp. WMMB6]
MKILVVGAGFSGAVVARTLAEANLRVEVIDKRDHIAGNAYDYWHESGIRVHKYGPHIFHTNNQRVVEWLSRFTEWVPYQHKVKAILDDGQYVTMPPNRETAEIVGRENIVDILFKPYTQKMWGLNVEEIDAQVLSRVPIRDDDNELYFPNDSFQALPKAGYTALIQNILAHPNITVSLNTAFDKSMEANYQKVFNSMPIDEYYDFCFGELPYRSIKFTNQLIHSPRLFPVPTVNFTNDGSYTRVTEWKLYPGHGESRYQTLLTYEEPCDYKENNMERFYPVKDKLGENARLYKQYKEIKNEKVEFIGRCGQYVYIDMHQAVSSSRVVADKYLNGLF